MEIDLDDDISKLSNSLSSLNSIKTTKSLSLNSINSNGSTNLSDLNNVNLDDDSLLLIFRKLNVKDLSKCSLVNKKFYQLTKNLINLKKKTIQLHYGVGPFNYYNNFNLNKYLDLSIDQSFYSPILIYDNSILINKINLLKSLESLVFITNQYEFANKSIYNFYIHLPNLKYLETNDKHFCNNLINLSRYPNKYSSLSIKHLIIYYSNLNTIIKLFPNLITLSIENLNLYGHFDNELMNDLDIKWKFLALKEERINDKFIDFLFKNCKQLNYLQINLAEFSKIDQFERLLKDLNWINEYYLFIFGATYEIKNLLFKYLYRFLNLNFKLTINFIRIEPDLKYLEPIYSANEIKQFKYFEIKQLENDKRTNLNRFEYYNKIKKLTIESNKQNLKFQNCNYQLNYVNELTIDDELFNDLNNCNDKLNSFDLDFNLLINNTLPKTITYILFKFNRNLAQYILDRLPIVLPYLEKITFCNLGERSYDFKFLFNLIYLNELNLLNIKFKDEEQLIDAIDNCKFLSRLKVVYDSKFIDHNLEEKFECLRNRLNLKLKKKEIV